MNHKLSREFLNTSTRPLALLATAALIVGCAQTPPPSSSGSSGSPSAPPSGGMPGAGMPSGGMPSGGTPSAGSPGASSPPGGGMPSAGAPGSGMPGSDADGSSGSSTSSGSSKSAGSSGSSSGDGSGDSGGSVGGVESIAGVPMPGGVGEFPGEGSGAGDAEALEKELDKSIGDFDEVLMEEQQQVQSVGRNTEGFDGTGGRGSDAGISLGQQAEGAMGSGGGSGGGAQMPDQKPPKPVASTMSAEEIAARTPDDIEVIIDSDIVAKQLREAALAEDDPELRERLWEEYRKYNGLD